MMHFHIGMLVSGSFPKEKVKEVFKNFRNIGGGKNPTITTTAVIIIIIKLVLATISKGSSVKYKGRDEEH